MTDMESKTKADEVAKTVRFPREMVSRVEEECVKQHMDFSKFVRRATESLVNQMGEVNHEQ